MKVLVVYAHPNPKSFNHAVLESFTKGLADAGHRFDLVDLYDIGFNPCLSQDDFDRLAKRETPDDIKIQQEKVTDADGLAFIHPIWWTGPPAILKGWIDRVFFMGFAYNIDEKTGHYAGLLKHRKAMVIGTAAASETEAKAAGLEDAFKKIDTDGIFRFCGIATVEEVIFHNVVAADDLTRRNYLNQAYTLGMTFE
ncbi:MAG: NAD(P)H-dependent oxidoreductase [Deltaproteobacteria bacterium]|nr:NAD(P)H-dependent oxidoreductase [Deltaproteobacteria bacterium]